MDIEDWSVVRSGQVAAAYDVSDAEIRSVYQQSDDSDNTDQIDLSKAIKIWKVIARPFHVRHLAVRFDRANYVISAHGNLVIKARGSVNLGLLFGSLGALPHFMPEPIYEEPSFHDAADVAIWRVLARLMRCEVPRQFRFEVGADIIICRADASGFKFLSGAADFGAFVALIRQHIVSGGSLRYTFEDAQKPSHPQTITDALIALCGQSDEASESWVVPVGGWPNAAPSQSNFEQLRAVMQFTSGEFGDARSMGALTFGGYGKNRAVRCAGSLNVDGTVTIRVDP